MKAKVNERLATLSTGPKHWFDTSVNPSDLIRRVIPPLTEGVYCIWWKHEISFPATCPIELPAGKRGVLSHSLKAWRAEFAESIALYVGKGSVRTRLLSHIKPAKQDLAGRARNPYEWLAKLFPNGDIPRIIQDNLGISYIEEQNKLEQVYAENLAIGTLRPWFNFRLTS